MIPTLCVVIPTYNRVETLLRCLAHLEAQTDKRFDVLIVDDGSPDDTTEQVARYSRTSPFAIRYIRQDNSGPARARNVAFDNADADLTVLIGDDIFAAPDFVEQHRLFHLANPASNAVAIGLTKWCEDGQKVTKFMRWLDAEGVQFGFGSLLAGRAPNWHDFYTSNLSFKSSYLNGYRFDESFVYAAYEDLELGWRLKRNHGMDLHFLRTAVADHLHPTDFLRSCKRMQMVGASAYTFKRLCPEFREFEPLPASRRKWFEAVSQSLPLAILSHSASILTSFWCPNPLTRRVLDIHARIGFDRAAFKAATDA